MVLFFAALGPVFGPSHGDLTAVAFATDFCASANDAHPAAFAAEDDVRQLVKLQPKRLRCLVHLLASCLALTFLSNC